jgi:hypothetical protein
MLLLDGEYTFSGNQPTFHRARRAGFSLHAGPVCETWQRSRLERLWRNVTWPPIAPKRLLVDSRGRVVYQYKQPFRDGSTLVVLEPLDFMFSPRSPLHSACFGGGRRPLI